MLSIKTAICGCVSWSSSSHSSCTSVSHDQMSLNFAVVVPVGHSTPALFASVRLVTAHSASFAFSTATSSADSAGFNAPTNVPFLANGGSVVIRSIDSVGRLRSSL